MLQPNTWLRRSLLILPGLLALGVIEGCSQVRIVQSSSEGGVVAIPNNSNQWPSYYRNRAEYLMSKECPEGYVIVREKVEEENPAAQDGRKPSEDFEYNGGYQRIRNSSRLVYLITFRKREPTGSASLETEGNKKPSNLPVSPSLPATEKDQQELPPPRPLPPNP